MKTASRIRTDARSFGNWLRENDIRRVPSWLITITLFLFSLFLRVGDFDAMVNVDMYFLWSTRIVRFMEGLEKGDFIATYQSHHPGVTLMWLVGSIWRAFGVLEMPMALHPEKARLAVWPVAIVGSLFVALTYPLLLRVIGERRRFAVVLVSVLLATEPLLVAHSRNPHLDVLATTFAWFAVGLAFAAKRADSYLSATASGVCLGLALLSKISTAGFALGIAAVYLLDCCWCRQRALIRLKQLTLIVAVSVVTIIVLWPALWVAPLETLSRLLYGLTHEVDKAIPFMLFEESGTMVVPAWVYGFFVVFLVTPEFWIPGFVGGLYLIRNKFGLRRFLFELSVVVTPLLYLVLSSNNVGVRNIILFLPLFAIFTALVVGEANQRITERWPRFVSTLPLLVLLLAVGGRTTRLISLYPLPITYCSRWTGVECSTVFQVGWGEGMREAATFIEDYKRERFPDDKSPGIYGCGYASIVRMWTAVKVVKRLEDAHFLVDYAPDWQRHGKRATAIAVYVNAHNLKPLHEVVIEGRPYVRIYSGPRDFR